LPTLDFGRSESVVRVNSIDTEYANDDLEAVLLAKTLPKALMVPKIESKDQVKWVSIYDTMNLCFQLAFFWFSSIYKNKFNILYASQAFYMGKLEKSIKL